MDAMADHDELTHHIIREKNMFRDGSQLQWQRIAAGNYKDSQDTHTLRHYRRSDGLEIIALRFNDGYKLSCKHATFNLIKSCFKLPLFELQNDETNMIGMSHYTKNPDIILKYLDKIDSGITFAAIRAEILCFFGITKPHPLERARQLEDARIYFLETVEHENDDLRHEIAVLKHRLQEYREVAEEQAHVIDQLDAMIMGMQQAHAEQDETADRSRLTRSF
jgi:hypothetical protein